MKQSFIAILLVAALARTASAQIEWRVSVKFFLDASGARPTGNISTNQDVQDEIDLGNAALAATGRGYQLRLTEIVDVSGLEGWFDLDVFAFKELLEEVAQDFPVEFAWRENAINIYINDFDGSGICSFPDDEAIFLGRNTPPTTIIHETGHFFSLWHTQGRVCGSCDPEDSGECHTTPGNDHIDDTLPDLECWNRNGIAQFSFGQDYDELNSAQQQQVDAVFFNIMSYHSSPDRFTDDQMDRMTDTSNEQRENESTGYTVFVDGNAVPEFATGSSIYPFATVADGAAVSSSDILLIRAGSYPENLTFTTPLMMFASRGSALIGD